MGDCVRKLYDDNVTMIGGLLYYKGAVPMPDPRCPSPSSIGLKASFS